MMTMRSQDAGADGDAPLSGSGGITKALFDQTCRKIRARTLAPDEQNAFEAQTKIFKENLATVLNFNNERMREAALE
jgi:hypothetical protein